MIPPSRERCRVGVGPRRPSLALRPPATRWRGSPRAPGSPRGRGTQSQVSPLSVHLRHTLWAAMRLVIVESPKKARTIQGFLGGGYRVAASMGHVRDLPPKDLGIDLAHDFAPQYVVL